MSYIPKDKTTKSNDNVTIPNYSGYISLDLFVNRKKVRAEVEVNWKNESLKK